jgi:hypothetical protein
MRLPRFHRLPRRAMPGPQPTWFKMMSATTVGILVAEWIMDETYSQQRSRQKSV